MCVYQSVYPYGDFFTTQYWSWHRPQKLHIGQALVIRPNRSNYENETGNFKGAVKPFLSWYTLMGKVCCNLSTLSTGFTAYF